MAFKITQIALVVAVAAAVGIAAFAMLRQSEQAPAEWTATSADVNERASYDSYRRGNSTLAPTTATPTTGAPTGTPTTMMPTTLAPTTSAPTGSPFFTLTQNVQFTELSVAAYTGAVKQTYEVAYAASVGISPYFPASCSNYTTCSSVTSSASARRAASVGFTAIGPAEGGDMNATVAAVAAAAQALVSNASIFADAVSTAAVSLGNNITVNASDLHAANFSQPTITPGTASPTNSPTASPTMAPTFASYNYSQTASFSGNMTTSEFTYGVSTSFANAYMATLGITMTSGYPSGQFAGTYCSASLGSRRTFSIAYLLTIEGGNSNLTTAIAAATAALAADPSLLTSNVSAALANAGYNDLVAQVGNATGVTAAVRTGGPAASSSSSGLSGGAIAGIVIGSIIGVAIIVGIIVAVVMMSGGSSDTAVSAKMDDSSQQGTI